MNTVRTLRTLALTLLMLVVSAAGARAQSTSGTPNNPRLSLSISAGAPGSDPEVQLKLASPMTVGIARIEAVLSLPAGKLDFDKIRGSLVLAEIVKTQTTLQEEKDGRVDVLLTIESPAVPTCRFRLTR